MIYMPGVVVIANSYDVVFIQIGCRNILSFVKLLLTNHEGNHIITGFCVSLLLLGGGSYNWMVTHLTTRDSYTVKFFSLFFNGGGLKKSLKKIKDVRHFNLFLFLNY